MKLARTLAVLAFCLPAQAFACVMYYEDDAELVAMMDSIEEVEEIVLVDHLDLSDEDLAMDLGELRGVQEQQLLAGVGELLVQDLEPETLHMAISSTLVADAGPSPEILPEG